MSLVSSIRTIATWELNRSMTTMGRNVLPLAAGLLVLLVLVTVFAAQSGVHMQDGIYRIGIDDPDVARVVATDSRFTIGLADGPALRENRFAYDVLILNRVVYVADTEKGRAAARTLERDYKSYVARVAAGEPDLFAAYPLWIDLKYVKSEIDFLATQSGQQVGAPATTPVAPAPSGPVEVVTLPPSAVPVSEDDLREQLAEVGSDHPLARYTGIFSENGQGAQLQTPSELSPPLPFDALVLVFVFIFPLYFTSQFFMMSVMNERVGRTGEPLLSTPVRPSAIVIGKALPYFGIMIFVSAAITLFIGVPVTILLPLIPVVIFFLANALIIGMAARSFKELSFVSIFFSTLATSYLFFPTVFANTHVISIISPLTLVVLEIQGEGFTAMEYVYSTALFFATSAVLFYVGTVNFREERLFSEKPLASRLADFVSGGISRDHPHLSLFLIAAFTIPFVFMAQMMTLVLFFNFPMPLSLVLLTVSAAFIEEVAKSAGLYAAARERPGFLTVKNLCFGAIAIGFGFLAGEKLLLFATLAQITESIFGSILFASLQVLWMPLLLHIAGVLITGTFLMIGGRRAYVPGLLVASVVHCLYNLYFLTGVLL
ncbi:MULTISPECIES: PrsW family intramembrane metalloprotease [unclassified Methanoculleus]|uniref:PrsW family intramembrane metalloprotease n=1 Tax=unclassified Methanoculleus TaxID=2619537 RepID=UPI0025FA9556|nr:MULTISPECIES: PrsW family intramembrane metalloprotease [unclassified Methanoculleus]MCK9318667.1 PrsW family intramembrane metalloprotease [Methanoculleus sp.]MDD2254552.1 PrsW family intramembrane metalloprotease [Methanoculleus sp.]MDD2787116.1 PrsW family intramembrane metalloprotease [Methanoculleus sp.]MDD3215988.1 PrsW family intramembrane metalloprotease [Methanoculleus sp.]MDD4314089.1 PrsW family intramembrane metalloprotease [Methanoculleus sp.]